MNGPFRAGSLGLHIPRASPWAVRVDLSGRNPEEGCYLPLALLRLSRTAGSRRISDYPLFASRGSFLPPSGRKLARLGSVQPGIISLYWRAKSTTVRG